MSAALRFGAVEIRPATRQLLIDGHAATLGSRAFDLLLALAERRDRVVRKAELLDLVWPGLVVEENNLQVQISTLRRLLGPRAIATLPGRGYRFTLPADTPADARPAGPGSTPTATSAAAAATSCTQLPPLLGRDDDLAALGVLLEQHRLVTLVGAGGIGKTLLARHLLDRRRPAYRHGVCWVELGELNDPAALPGAIAAALGLDIGGRDPLAALCAAVAPLAVLLALDNAEHLLVPVGEVARALLAAAPDLHLLATSQAPLKLAAERVYRLDALAVPQAALPAAQALRFGAVALFAERAQAADTRFQLTDADTSAAIDLCRALDGLPLAIELAAARAPALGVHRLAAAMDDRLRLLTRPVHRDAPARQHTLRAALEWSHELLPPRERVVFRRLAVFAGGASLPLLQQVAADEAGDLDDWAVLDALVVLVERSLVAVLPGTAADDLRYRLLETPRLYALELLRAAGEEPALRRRHARALAAWFDQQWAERYSGRIGVGDWKQRLAQDAGNAFEAIAWAQRDGQPADALTIAATLLKALPGSQHTEQLALADTCCGLLEQVQSPPLRLRAWLAVGAALGNARPARAAEAAEQALALARELDVGAADRWPLYHALSAWIAVAAPRGPTARTALSPALAELAALEDPHWPAQRLLSGMAARSLAHQAIADDSPHSRGETLQRFRRTLAMAEAAGTDQSLYLTNVMDAELACGDAAAAVGTGRKVLQLLARSRDEAGLAFARLNLGAALLALNETAEARSVLHAGWSPARRLDLQQHFAVHLASLAALERRPRAAAQLAGCAEARYAAAQETRETNEVSAIERACALARAALGEEEFERQHAAGTALSDEEISAVAFSSDDAP